MPTTIKKIEILAYSPKKMDEFLTFCADGKPISTTEWQKDSQGREIRGVFSWLYGRSVPEAHFFNTAAGVNPQLFFATVQRLEADPVPWIDDIPGFPEMIQADGIIGAASEFKPIGDLLKLVSSNAELDRKFEEGRMRIARILESLERHEGGVSMEKEDFLAALRGDIGSNQALLAEVTKAFSVSA